MSAHIDRGCNKTERSEPERNPGLRVCYSRDYTARAGNMKGKAKTVLARGVPIYSPNAVLANKSIYWLTNQVWLIQQDAHQRYNF
jgi:hypothetical protein